MLKNFLLRTQIACELVSFLWKEKMWWMIPMVSVLLLLALLMIMVQGSAVTPFIYTMFWLFMLFILKNAWQKWKTVARHIGVFQSRVILTLFYFTILLPFGIIFSLFKDEMEIKRIRNSKWKIKTKQTTTIEDLREQFW